MNNKVNRILSNEEILNEIEKQFDIEDYSKITIHTTIFEETGAMSVGLFFDDEYLETRILEVENDMIVLQKEIKEIGSLLTEKYNIIPKIEVNLFDGLKPEYIF
jgi:hypothetical protein